MSSLSASRVRRAAAFLGMSVMFASGAVGFGAGSATAQDAQCWTSEPSMESGYPQWAEAPAMAIDDSMTYTATVVTNHGAIVIELAASEAPVTVNNFVCLAQAGYYDFTLFHRVIDNFMIQGGDPTGTGSGSPGYQINDELPTGETPYVRGTVAMANAGANTNGSQFFIVHADQPAGFKPNYSIFGQVTEGLNVLDSLVSVPVMDQRGEPSDPIPTIGIESIEIEQDGQPMGSLQGDDLEVSETASPTVDSPTSAGEPATEVSLSTEEPASTGDEDDEVGGMVWAVGGVAITALAALGYGLYRRSRGGAAA